MTGFLIVATIFVLGMAKMIWHDFDPKDPDEENEANDEVNR